jgi:hypothetical protein
MRMLRRLVEFVRRAQADREIAEEIETHRQMTERRLRESGLSAAQAAVESRRLMGNTTLAREDARAVSIAEWIEGIWQDVRCGFRTLARQPGFTLLALATLGSAIGLNTSLFAGFNGILWRPWPVADPARVVIVNNVPDQAGFTLAEFRYFSAHAQFFDGFVATRCTDGVSKRCLVELDGEDAGANFVTSNFATYVPARRAASIEPVGVLRTD